METFAIATDLHGDRQDESAVKGFRKFVKDFGPDWKFFLGDIFDFRAIRMGADKEDRMHSMEADFQAGMEFLEWYQPDAILLGNHDQRLWDVVEKDGLRKSGPLVDLAKRLIGEFEALTEKLGTVVLPYDKRKGVYQHNGLRLLHGFDGLDPAKMAAIYGNVIYGHGHAFRSAPAPGLETRIARMIGGLARKDMTYNRAQTRTLDQQQGWAYGAFTGKNKFEVFEARIEGDQVAYASDLKLIKL